MSFDVEVNFRIPAVKEPAQEDKGYPIKSADVSFIGVVSVPALPKREALLQLEMRDKSSIECAVNRADWSESKELFIVYCTYSKKSILPDEYKALLSVPGWEMRPLL